MLNGGAPILVAADRGEDDHAAAAAEPAPTCADWDGTLIRRFPPIAANCCRLARSGIPGFTGTSLWIDPTTNTYIILLTNCRADEGGQCHCAAHRGGDRGCRGPATDASRRAEDAAGAHHRLQRSRGGQPAHRGAQWARCRMASMYWRSATSSALKRCRNVPTARIGLVTNQTGVDSTRHGAPSTFWRMLPGCNWRPSSARSMASAGTLDTTDIANSKDAATGVPIYSVYGDTDAKRRPSPDVLRKTWMCWFTTFRMPARASTPTKPRWDIFWKPRPRRASRSSCWTGPIRSPALTCRARCRMLGRRASSTTIRCRCGTV